MSLYNMLFGMNPQSDLLLAVIGLRQHDIERFRDASVSEDGKHIYIYSRTGGGNRDDYPNAVMRHVQGWVKSVDDDFDNTYCTDTISVPDEFVKDVLNLADLLGNGMRAKFGKHLLKTLRRKPTEADIAHNLYEHEKSELAKTRHEMANGHTFVPHNDSAMETALKLAELNNGELRSSFGILPLGLTVKQNYHPWPKAKSNSEYLRRVEIGYEWVIDTEYWEHCKKVFTDKFPLSIAHIDGNVIDYLERENRKTTSR